MGARLDLHDLLVSILGSSNVYFQPPATVQMKYPCIVYRRNDINSQYADDQNYNAQIEYLVTVIEANPDSLLVMKMLSIPMCRFDRYYTADNLNHDVYRIYY